MYIQTPLKQLEVQVKDLYATYFAEYIWRRKFITTSSKALYVLCEHILEYHGFDPTNLDSDNDVD